MRILVADAFPEQSLNHLVDRAHDVTYEPDTTAETLPTVLDDHEVLVVRSTRVPAEAIERATRLRLIIRAGSGTNTIDCAAATQHGVPVCNVPGRNSIAVAELACALLLALDRNIVDNVADLRAGTWAKKRYSQARGVYGRRVGVIGLGQIGLAFAERAAALGTTVYAVAKPNRAPETAEHAAAIGVEFVDSLATLAETCDVLSLHAPATEATRHLVGRELLDRVQPGTIILNTSRSDLVDEQALVEAMDRKGVRAGVDVFADEPAGGTGEISSALAGHPNVYGTHHIGASTEQAQQAVASEVVRMIEEFESGSVLHSVNTDALHTGEHEQVVTALGSGSRS